MYGAEEMAAPVMIARWEIGSEEAGLCSGLDPGGSKLKDRGAGGAGSSASCGGWGGWWDVSK